MVLSALPASEATVAKNCCCGDGATNEKVNMLLLSMDAVVRLLAFAGFACLMVDGPARAIASSHGDVKHA